MQGGFGWPVGLELSSHVPIHPFDLLFSVFRFPLVPV